MIQTKVKYIKNIVQKSVGLLGLKLSTSAYIVENKLSQASQLTRNTVTKSAGTGTTEKGSKDMTPHNGKAEKLRRTNVLELPQRLESGVKRFMNGIIMLVSCVVEEARRAIELKYTHTTLNHYLNILNSLLMLVTGRLYVLSATGKQIVGVTTNYPKYCDVIRKRYAKFIGKEEQWQKI